MFFTSFVALGTDVNVDLSTEDGSATSGLDYTGRLVN